MASSSTTATAPLDHSFAGGMAFPSPPPPTPSNHTLSPSPSSAATDATLSRLLRQLTPTTLCPSPPSRLRRASSATTTDPLASPPPPPPPPTISLLDPHLPLLSYAATDHAFFHLSNHGVSSELAVAACLESQSLLLDSHHRQNRGVLGFDLDDDDDEEDSGFLVFDVNETGTDPLSPLSVPSAVAEFAKEMGKAGVQVVEKMLSVAGLKSPFVDGETRPRCLMWVSSSADAADGGYAVGGGRRYPYAVCLQYEMRTWRECGLLAGDESDEVAVLAQHDSVLVTVGDIAQVWSNGRFRKVRGRPLPILSEDADKDSLTLSLLVTLPTDSVVSPLPLRQRNSNEDGSNGDGGDFDSKFCSFPFEQYAWRLYNERLTFKDPLNRYRI